MRIIIALLAFMVLGLNSLPCSDPGLLGAKVDTDIVANYHQDTGGAHDLCSPFCQCACCATYSVVKLPLYLPSVTYIGMNKKYPMGRAQHVLNVSLAIWQPPQLV